MLKFFLLISLMISPLSWASNLIDVKNYQKEGQFVSELVFDGPVDPSALSLDFINETIQVDVAGASLPSGKMHKTVADPMVRSTFAYQAKEGVVRNRIIYKGVPATTFKDKVDFVASNNSVKIVIGDKVTPQPSEDAKSATKSVAMTPPNELKEVSDKHKVASKEDLETQALLETVDQEITADLEAHKEEESIPLTLASNEAKAAETNPWMRMLISLGIVGAVGLIAALVVQRMKRTTTTSGANTQIKVLTQHAIGPKKNLAIIRVAGESILIGITDHNISMIKSLSLLDEDIPEEVPKDFGGVLGKLWERDAKVKKAKGHEGGRSFRKSKKSATDDEEFSIEGIKDIVSNRLKDMRPIE